MADLEAARRHRATHHHPVDIEALRRSVQVRMAGRQIPADGAARAIQKHAEAIGRGEPSISPAKGRVRTSG